MIERKLVIQNRYGLHARPAAIFSADSAAAPGSTGTGPGPLRGSAGRAGSCRSC